MWHQYVEVMTSPGHTLAEATFTLLEFILFSIIWAKVIKPRWERMLEALHTKLDREHGHEHEEVTSPPEE